MAYSIAYNVSDTPISGADMKLQLPAVNFSTDFRVERDEPDELIVTNLTSPIGIPERFRFGFSTIANVYNGTRIEPAMRSQMIQGVSVLCQLNDTWTVTDSADPTYSILLPVSCHVVLKVPNSPALTGDNIQYLLTRTISGLMPQGQVGTQRLAALLRGSLRP